MPEIVWWLDATGVGLGAALALGAAVHLLQSGRWREPLHMAPPLHTQADFFGVLLTFVVYAGVVLLLQHAIEAILGPPEMSEGALRPGAARWHWLQSADLAGKLVACGIMLWLLRPATADGTVPRSGAIRVGLISFGAFLALLPLMSAQLQLGRAVWHWLHPDAPLPEHMVLEALRQSAWGAWGRAQLILAAVLVAPLVEELFFRGVVLDAFRRVLGRHWPAIVASAVVFGVVHAQPQDKLPLVTMGLVLGYLRVRYAALWPCVVVHVLFNLRTMLAAVLMESDGVD
ncbi:MAG: CPBP family intramembrane metalloprotease [Phycisphaerales bacterium]|nr:CPBP family intramembrane metalloprotease [Phycisphaerales bacterium]